MGRAVERQASGRRDQGSKPPLPFRSLSNFVHPTLPVSFGIDTKSRWSILSGVYVRGSKIPHAGKWGKKPVMDSLTLGKDTRKNQEDPIGNKCTLVCFNVLSSVLLDTKKPTETQTFLIVFQNPIVIMN